jgi:hypothetical protein
MKFWKSGPHEWLNLDLVRRVEHVEDLVLPDPMAIKTFTHQPGPTIKHSLVLHFLDGQRFPVTSPSDIAAVLSALGIPNPMSPPPSGGSPAGAPSLAP